MKETVRSLRMYFGIVGVLGAVLNALVLLAPDVAMPMKAVALLSIALAAVLLYVASTLPTLLRTRLPVVLAVVVLLPVVAILGAVVGLVTTGKLVWLNPVITFVVAAYLFANVKRLAAEPATVPA